MKLSRPVDTVQGKKPQTTTYKKTVRKNILQYYPQNLPVINAIQQAFQAVYEVLAAATEITEKILKLMFYKTP